MIGDASLRRNSREAMMTPVTFLIFLFITISKQNLAHAAENSKETLQNTSPAYAVTLEAETTLNSSACARQLGIFRDAIEIRKLWALRVLDASGMPKPGFIYGNNYWLGSRSQCLDTTNKTPLALNQDFVRNATRFRKPEDEFPPFAINYFVARFRHNSTLQYHTRLPNEDLVTLGLCLPAICTTAELGSILKRVFQERILMIGSLYAADFELENVKDLQDDHMWLLNGKYMIICFFLLLTICAMVAGTTYDVLVYQKYLKAIKQLERDNFQNNNTPEVFKNTVVNAESLVPMTVKQPTVFGEILKCFSIYTNTKIIFDTKLGSDSVAPIHGLRFIGMLWIILIHTVFYMVDFMDNKPWAWRMADGFAVQVLSNATLSVDTYFFLSGFLATYLYYKENLKNKKENDSVNYKSKAVEFFCAILKRFIRLTPAYMMMIGIMEINSGWYGETSLFYMNEKPQQNCANYWWRNLLYINNLFGRDTMCLSWSWYLANDMQFFIIGTFIVILSSIYFYSAVTILVCVLLSSTLFTGYMSYIYGYVPTLDEQLSMLDILYDRPWTRIGPYIVGMVTAYIIVKLKNKWTLRRRNLVILWVLGSSCNLFVLFGLYDRYISVLSSAFYVALSRMIWGVGIGWLLIACCTNHGGIINSFLSFRGWVPLSRLTYSAYLINPFIITSIFLHSESSMHVDFLPTGSMFLGNAVITYCCSYVYSIMMETPYVLIMRLLTRARPLKH